MLNPFFAFLAFIGVLLTLDKQNKRFKQMTLDKQGEEILTVIKDIDTRISELLKTDISSNSSGETLIHHMVSESERIRNTGSSLESSKAYCSFLTFSRENGTIVEAAVRELRTFVLEMHNFAQKYEKNQQINYSPLIDYYIEKNRQLILMLDEIQPLSQPLKLWINSYPLPKDKE